MKKNPETINVNVGSLLSTLLLVAFIVLKLCHVIEWAWVWVLAPLWIPVALVLVIFLIAVIVSVIADHY